MDNQTAKKKDDRREITRDQILGISRRVGESIGAMKQRLDALEVYRRTPLPTRWVRGWKYSQVERFLPEVHTGNREDFQVSVGAGPECDARLLAGRDLFVSLPKVLSEKGVEIRSLGDHQDNDIGTLVGPSHGIAEAMNSALWTSGILVRVPAGVHLEDPIHLHVHTFETEPFVRLFVHLEPGARADVMQTIHGKGSVSAVAEVQVDRGARLSHGIVFEGAKDDVVHYTQRGRVGEDARLDLFFTSFGQGHLKADIGSILAGQRATSDIRSFFLVNGKGTVDVHTVQHHILPDAHSNLVFGSVLSEMAMAANTGLIRVDPGADRSEAYQEARNLLLNETARAMAIPELEILTNDVVCSHGAATGPIDDDQLFYLMSRGLDLSTAIRLIVEGLWDRLVAPMPDSIRGILSEFKDNPFDRHFGVRKGSP